MNRTEVFLLVWAVLLALYALYAAVFLPKEFTVSATMTRLSVRWPVIPFALGLLLAHFFWNQE